MKFGRDVWKQLRLLCLKMLRVCRVNQKESAMSIFEGTDSRTKDEKRPFFFCRLWLEDCLDCYFLVHILNSSMAG